MTRQVVVGAEGGSLPTPSDGNGEGGSPATRPTTAAAACIPSMGQESGSHSRKEGDGQQRSLSGSLKKKIGEFVTLVYVVLWWQSVYVCVLLCTFMQAFG